MAKEYWYDTSTGQVQELEKRGQQKDLLGPYTTREEAEHALERARARTAAEDERDREEEDW
ncbi:SPOR domain-containing protein [Kineococcus sp. SYSU DK003]|uniref:SPOR domain-containing protein n=1 Tax=Kineococcus sp. SYSU DK003 TaxID=3383124 RepID=UPI003D7D23ED